MFELGFCVHNSVIPGLGSHTGCKTEMHRFTPQPDHKEDCQCKAGCVLVALNAFKTNILVPDSKNSIGCAMKGVPKSVCSRLLFWLSRARLASEILYAAYVALKSTLKYFEDKLSRLFRLASQVAHSHYHPWRTQAHNCYTC